MLLPAAASNRHKILFVGIMAAVLVLAAAIGAALTLRENTRRDWTSEMSNLSLILAEHAAQTLFSANTALDRLYDLVTDKDIKTEDEFRAFASQESVYRLMIDKTSVNPIIDVATFVDRNGSVLNFTRSYPPPPINLSDRDYFIAHSVSAGVGTHTSVPVHNKGTGTWVFYLSRRIDNPRGEMLGLVLVGVSVEVFSRFYERVAKDLGPGASISLFRDDFTLMTRWPFAEDFVGKKILTNATYRTIAMERRNSDVVFIESARETEEGKQIGRLSAPRRVERYPFIVTPVITASHYMRGWYETVAWIIALTICTLALVASGVVWLLRANKRIESELQQRQQAQARIEHLAFHDVLTQLPNRRLLADQLQRSIADSRRRPSNHALLFLDLDNFKEINDTHGHDHGDHLLREVAKRLVKCVRQVDTVARVGGDEFAILLNRLNLDVDLAAAEADAVAGKITHTLAEPFAIGGVTYHTTVSIGMTLFGLQSSDVEELFKHADIAMYQAKAAGKNTHQFFDSGMQQLVDERSDLVNALRDAIDNSLLNLYYQPQVNSDGELIGAEALLRWSAPGRGAVSPAVFVPLAEQTGLISQLGSYVLDVACETLARWASDPALARLTLAVNVSAQQLRMPDFVATVLSAIKRTNAPSDRLKLELTESMLAHDLGDVRAKMALLRKHGIQFALDDFGTGYSSLSYLRELSIDQLKIDWSFVRDVLDDPNDEAIVRAIVNLGQILGMEVIAEGVETEAQKECLISVKCFMFQGYLFGKPLPLDEFESLARNVVPRESC